MKNWIKENKKELIFGICLTLFMWAVNAQWAIIGRMVWLGQAGWQLAITTPVEAVLYGIFIPISVIGCMWLSKKVTKKT